jgi:hypothetical protein
MKNKWFPNFIEIFPILYDNGTNILTFFKSSSKYIRQDDISKDLDLFNYDNINLALK